MELIPEIDSEHVVMVTDREGGIVKAIRTIFNSLHLQFCWNHMQQDIKIWLKKTTGTPKDRISYVAYVKELLESSSEDFQSSYDVYRTEWSYEFLTYFDKYLLNDVKNNIKGTLLRLGVYKDKSGLTTNASESLNTVLKRLTQ